MESDQIILVHLLHQLCGRSEAVLIFIIFLIYYLIC